MMPITIALVDDHRVVTQSLRSYLAAFPDFAVVGAAHSGEELLAHLDAWNPRVIVQDLLLPGGLDGIETTRRVLARKPHIGVVALTASMDEARMMGVLRVGALGYVRKDAEPEVLLAAVRSVARGTPYIDPAVGRHIAQSTMAADDLTQRELEVLRQLALGRSNKAIAAELSIATVTVKTHVSHVLSKLQVEGRAQAIVHALKRGLVTLDELS